MHAKTCEFTLTGKEIAARDRLSTCRCAIATTDDTHKATTQVDVNLSTEYNFKVMRILSGVSLGVRAECNVNTQAMPNACFSIRILHIPHSFP